MEKIIQYFFSDLHAVKQSFWFKKALYAAVAISCVYWLLNYYLYFGENSIVFRKTQVFSGIRDIAFILYATPSLSFFAILTALTISTACLIVKRAYYLTDIVLWLIVINLQYAVYAGLTAGDYLFHQFLFFNIFIRYRINNLSGFGNQTKILLHNLAVFAVMVQVCLLYFLAGSAKLFDADWMMGTALAQTGMVPHFDMHVPALFTKQGLFTKMINYLVLFYQVLFPILVWMKKVKKVFLLLGVLMHLYIAVAMGLVSFGMIMLLAYIYFWPAKTR